MKMFPILVALVLTAFCRVSAQVTVDLALSQEEYLPGEPLIVAAKITNQSGRQLHLGDDPSWLTFNVESMDGFVVIKNAEVPVMGGFDLESSQAGTKRVDLAPYFTMTRAGHYKVTATLRIKDWSAETPSAPQIFDVITGAKLWEQEFGVPATNGVPEMRKFTLEQASYLNSNMRLYVQLSDADETRIYRTELLGQTVSFSHPEGQIDRNSVLHVLWQSGAQAFDYREVNAAGEVVRSEIYDDLGTRPRLSVDENSGDTLVVGGVRRPKPGELPVLNPPAGVPDMTGK